MPHFEHDGGRIAYHDAGGDGPPLLLFHAFPLSSAMWSGGVRGARVIAPDLSGFGASSAPSDPAAYSVDRWADEGAALLDHLGIERAAVGGCSMGGYVTLAFLRRHRERASAAVFVDTRADADTDAIRENRARQQRMVREGRKAELLDELFGKLLSERGKADGRLAGRVRAMMEQPDDGIVGALEAMKGRPDSTGDLPGLGLPALVIVGEADVITPPSTAEGIAGAIAGARLAVLPGAGHLANLEKPEEFEREVASFLRLG